jgi:hypothetical protein
LNQYDKSNLKEIRGKESGFVAGYELCLDIVSEIKKELSSRGEASDIFGIEVNHKFESLIKSLYQTFDGNEKPYGAIEFKEKFHFMLKLFEYQIEFL